MTRILLCDDDRGDLSAIAGMVEAYYDGVAAASCVVTCFHDPIAALGYVEDGNAVDIAILDIIMPEMSGIELAARMRELDFSGYLVFLSTINDYAAQSYAVNAYSYIVKPPEKKAVFELLSGVEKARQAMDRGGFPLTRRSGVRFIQFSELMYAEVTDHRLHFHLIDGEVVSIYASLREFSEILLREPRMLQPHKSFIVNMDYVRACENRAIFMRDGARISVPRGFSEMRAKYLEWMFGQTGW